MKLIKTLSEIANDKSLENKPAKHLVVFKDTDEEKNLNVLKDVLEKKTMLERKAIALPFDPAKLNGISEKLITSHWENNYQAAIKALNIVGEKLAIALSYKDTPPTLIGDLKRDHLFRTGSIVYHELYFNNLGGDGKQNGFNKVIEDHFESYEKWEHEFRQIAASLSGGSGWVILGYNPHVGTIENYWAWDHMHAAVGTLPLLVMDMYEHSYQMDYGADAQKYIDAFFNNIAWDVVAKRYEQVRQLTNYN